jgi:hypothetical protein
MIGTNDSMTDASSSSGRPDETEMRTTKLKGYSYPLSAKGEANLASAPPWHYAGEMLGVEFWTSPRAAAATLPDGLTIDPDGKGRAAALFFDWQFSGSNEEYLDPARYQYREFMILVNALWNETKVAWCPYIFVDNDAALARGWIQGFPKKMGLIAQTRTIGLPSPAAPSVGPGGRFAASASAAGRRLVEAEVTLETPLSDGSALFRPIVNLRYFPRLTAGRHYEPAVNELVMSLLHDLKIHNAWAGKARLTLPDAPREEIADLAPERIGIGFRASLSYTVKDLRVLTDLRHCER